MPVPILKKISIPFILLFLTVTAFWLRLENFQNPKRRTIDEVVYYNMANQVAEEGLSGYNTIPYGKYLSEEKGRKLPSYFFKPLFKHPPVYVFCLALSIKIFGKDPISAGYISILFGVLMIPLVYLIGKLFFDKTIGLLSSFVVFMDPLNIICSMKVWMDTTLAFFMVLTIYLFAYAVKKGNDKYFLFSGIAAGFAVLTKYPGILSLIIILLYSIVFDPGVFKRKKFLQGIGITVLMFLPWLIWNLSVYGLTFFAIEIRRYGFFRHNVTRSIIVVGFIFVFLAALFKVFHGICFSKSETGDSEPNNDESPADRDKLKPIIRKGLILAYGLFFAYLLQVDIMNCFNLTHIPYTTWYSGRFNNPLFYFGRLMEFSPIYLFAFSSFFVMNSKAIEGGKLLYLGSVIIFMFYLLWGKYQSRYILAATPFLIILGVQCFSALFGRCSSFKNKSAGLACRVFLSVLTVYIFMKVTYLNFLVSYPHDMCYF